VAAANNVSYVVGLYYQAAPWDRLEFNYTHAVHMSGVVEPYTPSPVDRTWWNKTMFEPAVAIANLSLYYPIWGLVWDIELYGHAAMLRTDYSYDLPAIHAFANASNITVPSLKVNGGYSWLKGKGLLGPYHRWLEETVYQMARRTERAVHSINPRLNLGLLGTEDSWHHWAILRGFNCSTASVTAWGEQCYGGWDSEAVSFFQNKFREYGLNGKYIPGIMPAASSVSFGKFLWELGSAVRQNGVFWLYQYDGDPFTQRGKDWYAKVYGIFDDFVFFKGSDVYPLPEVELLPGAYGCPYLAPNGTVSLFIFTHEPDRPFEKELVPFGFTIRTHAENLTYVGENLSRRVLHGPDPFLRPEDFPCIVYGLSPEDLVATEAWSLYGELESLLELFDLAGIGVPDYGEGPSWSCSG